MVTDVMLRLRALFRRRAMEQELDDELRFHLEREVEKYVRAGVARDEAERRARLAFGGLARIKDDARDARGIAMVDALSQDLRYAWRRLTSKPGFAIAVVLTLALGIGANTAMFGVVDRMLLRPPAYLAAPEETHRVLVAYLWNGSERTERYFAYTRYLDLLESTRAFARMAAFSERTVAVGTGEQAREMTVGAVSASLFDFFHARPVLGRFFTADEDRPPVGALVAVLGYGYWRSAHGGRPDVIGQTLHIGPQIYTIIGVAPEGFVGPLEGRTPIAFVPVTAVASARNTTYHRNYNWSWLEILVRRRPGVSVAAANADLTAAYRRSWTKEAEMDAASGFWPSATAARARGEVTPVLLGRGPDADANARIVVWVMGVAVIVLLVACANVANLLLARALSRRREIALRFALGVTRRRLLQQLLTESVLLAVIGGAAGLGLARWGSRALRALFLRADEAGAVLSDPRTLLFAATATLGVAVLTGLAPALHSLRGDVASSLKAGPREGTYRRSRVRVGLLLFQGALSVVLLVGAGLFVRSLSNVRSMRLGYDVDPVVFVQGNDRGVHLTPAEQNALLDRLVAAAVSSPGVRSATPVTSIPFYSFEGRGAPVIAGRDSLGKLGSFVLQVGNASYFATAGTRILRGRGITDEDRGGARLVVVVSEAMATALWPGRNPIGEQLRFGRSTGPAFTVVGVAENVRGRRLQGNAEFWYYLSIDQYEKVYGPGYPQVLVRVSGRAEDFVEPLRRRLQREMPGAAYVTAMPLGQLIAPQRRSWEFGATMFAAFGGLALLLAAVGLYSVIAYSVAQRKHELGVRIALGARMRDVVGMVVGQGVTFAVAGIAIGSLIALWAGRWAEPLLFEQSARDPLIYGSVAVVLLIVALLATVRPALRATRVDPNSVLRAD
ncbi:MAG: ADOP family duplicated permease [Gemmatimonadaceae bacterium]